MQGWHTKHGVNYDTKILLAHIFQEQRDEAEETYQQILF